MSALDIKNTTMDSEHASAIATIGQNQIQITAPQGKESMEGLRNDFSKGEGGAKTGKASYDTLAEGYKLAPIGERQGEESQTADRWLGILHAHRCAPKCSGGVRSRWRPDWRTTCGREYAPRFTSTVTEMADRSHRVRSTEICHRPQALLSLRRA